MRFEISSRFRVNFKDERSGAFAMDHIGEFSSATDLFKSKAGAIIFSNADAFFEVSHHVDQMLRVKDELIFILLCA
jgi:hypothetical protein